MNDFASLYSVDDDCYLSTQGRRASCLNFFLDKSFFAFLLQSNPIKFYQTLFPLKT